MIWDIAWGIVLAFFLLQVILWGGIFVFSIIGLGVRFAFSPVGWLYKKYPGIMGFAAIVIIAVILQNTHIHV